MEGPGCLSAGVVEVEGEQRGPKVQADRQTEPYLGLCCPRMEPAWLSWWDHTGNQALTPPAPPHACFDGAVRRQTLYCFDR